MTKIDLSYPNALKLIMPEVDSLNLTLVGCGGTGSWLAPAVVRVAKLLIDRFSKEVTVTFYDPDQVEEKNIYRQNFCAAEIGRNKAETLAYRYSLAWGIEILAAPAQYKEGEWAGSSIVIGCVDNAAARQSIRTSVADRGWWLDSGNTRNSGQILLGRDMSRWGKENAFELSEFCSWLPSPAMQHPELVETTTLEEAVLPGADLSCAEMALQDSQGLAINQRMAAEAADYLVRMLITKDLKKFATYVDLESGTAKSKYITKKEIGRWMK